MTMTSVVAPGEGEGFASDEIAGVHHPISKMAFGAENAAPTLVSAVTPMPVEQIGTPELPDGAASETTLASILADTNTSVTRLTSILAKLVQPQNGMPSDDMDFLPVLTVPAFSMRIGFAEAVSGGVDTDFMTILGSIGTGMTVNQSAGNLVITEGTTASAETICRSVDSVKGNIVLRASVTLSQRNANNNSIIELVDRIGDAVAFEIVSSTVLDVTIPAHGFHATKTVGQSMEIGAFAGLAGVIPGRYAVASVPDADTLRFTVAGFPGSGSGTCYVFGWNYYRLVYLSTSATSMSFECQRNGYRTGPTAVTINTTATGHVPTFSGSDGEFMVSDQAGASGTGIELTRRGSSIRNVPLNETELYLQVRATNGTSAPTATTFTVGFVDVGNCVTQNVTIQNVSPQSGNTGLPVEILAALPAGTAVIGSVTLNAGTSLAGDVGQQYRATATGAASGGHLIAASSTNATNLKGSAGRLLGWQLYNAAATVRFVKFHNTSGTPTAGTAIVRTVAIPPLGKSEFMIEGGNGFSTGIGYTTVTGSADADTAAVTAGDIVGDIYYA